MADRRSVAWRRHLRTLVLMVLALAAMRWCVLAAVRSDMQGTVLDSRTGQPVEGAVVVAWVAQGGILGPVATRAQVAEGRTDDVGRFRLSLESRRLLTLVSARRSLVVVADGYQAIALSPNALDAYVHRPDSGVPGSLLVRLDPRAGGAAASSAFKEVVELLGQAYGGLSPVCAEVEVPQLLQFLRRMQSVRPQEAIDKRKWDERRDCVN